MLSYSFMQRAFIMALFLSILLPSIGQVIVLKKLSLLGDALSHISLSGVGIGLIMGFNPVAGAFVACIIAALLIEGVRRKLPMHSDIAVALIMSTGVGIAGLLSTYVPSSASFMNFLFGSIVAVTKMEVYVVIGAAIVVLTLYGLLYRELYLISLDKDYARLSKIRVNLVEVIFTILTALSIAISSRIVGALLISSLLVVPVGSALLWKTSYKFTLIISIIYAVIATLVGLTFSYYIDSKPGSTIVLLSVSFFLVTLVLRGLFKRSNS